MFFYCDPTLQYSSSLFYLSEKVANFPRLQMKIFIIERHNLVNGHHYMMQTMINYLM